MFLRLKSVPKQGLTWPHLCDHCIGIKILKDRPMEALILTMRCLKLSLHRAGSRDDTYFLRTTVELTALPLANLLLTVQSGLTLLANTHTSTPNSPFGFQGRRNGQDQDACLSVTGNSAGKVSCLLTERPFHRPAPGWALRYRGKRPKPIATNSGEKGKKKRKNKQTNKTTCEKSK